MIIKKLGSIIDRLKQGENSPTRHYNPYFSEALSLSEYLLTSSELEKQEGCFFEEKKALIIEIGCYMGKNILEMSAVNSDKNFIGLDITYKRVVKAARKISKIKSKNAKIVFCEGEEFLNSFIMNEDLKGVCIFFPDPWPKDRHEKNRLLKKEFIELLYKKIENGGFFWFKSDHERYFKETEQFIFSCGFVADKQQYIQPQELQGGPFESAFQKLFTEKGTPFFHGIYRK